LELLYTLVTDSGFVYERAVVWESLQDVDQAMAAFYDSWFCPSHDTSHPLEYLVGSTSNDRQQVTKHKQDDLEQVFLFISLINEKKIKP
jgi:hypothetical protein